jgi:CheY-like chemotaxis protein
LPEIDVEICKHLAADKMSWSGLPAPSQFVFLPKADKAGKAEAIGVARRQRHRCLLKALARLLRVRSFHVKTYQSTHEFLSVLPDGLPECLIVDWQMPEMNGLELLRDMARAGIRVPTIIISAHGDASVRQRCSIWWRDCVSFKARAIQRPASCNQSGKIR